MITKKVGRITYAWDPNSFNGKGWWWELGKDGNYGLAATKALGAKLGKPSTKDLPPKGSNKRYYYDIGKTGRTAGKPVRRRYRTGVPGDEEGPSQYEKADITKQKGLIQLASERMASGENTSMIGSLKGAISDKLKARATGIKKKFDPLNLLSKLPLGQLAATSYGMKKGRSAADIAYFTGVQPTLEKQLHDEEPTPSEPSKKTASKVSKSEKSELNKSSNGILKQIYKLLSDKFEEDKKLREIDKNFDEERKSEDDKKHKELIDAILKNKSPKEKKEKKEEKNTLMDLLMGGFNLLKGIPSMIMSGISGLIGLKTLGKIGGKVVRGVASFGKSIVKGGVKLARKAGSMIKGGVKSVMGFGSKMAKGAGGLLSKGADAAEKAGSALAKGGGKMATKVAGAGSKILKGGGKLLGFLKAVPGLSLITAGADLIMRIKEVNDKKAAGELSDAEYKKEIVKAIGSAAAAGLLPVLGASIGSIVPGVGTVIGGLGGAAAALMGGDKIGGWVAGKMYDYFVDDKKGTASEVKKSTATEVSSATPAGAPSSTDLPTSGSPTPQSTPSASPANVGSPALTSRMNEAVATNQNLVGPAATQTTPSSPIITNKTSIVNTGGGAGSGGGVPMSMRNEDPVLLRLQYGNVKPV